MACRVLIVDADESTRAHLAAMLVPHGYVTLFADGMAAARQLLDATPPDLLLTEVRLDGYNGLHLIATAPSAMRAVVITAYADAAIEKDARRLGADYLTKPVDEERLLAAVARQLSRGRSEDLFIPARQWPRTRLRAPMLVRLDGVPALIHDVSDGGARLELEKPQVHVQEPSGPIPLQCGALTVPMYVAWERQLGPRRCACGLQVSHDATERWRTFVAFTLAADAGQPI